MTPEHFIFIPTIFLVGFLVGRQTADQSTGLGTRTRPLAISFLIVMLVFIATHILPYFGGVKSITLVTGGLRILDSAPAFSAEEVYGRLEAFGGVGREMYQRFTYTSDVIFPLSFLMFLFFLIRFVLQIYSGRSRLAQILYALPVVMFKYVAISENFWDALVYEFIGAGIGAGILMCWSYFRSGNFLAEIPRVSNKIWSIIYINEGIYIAARFLTYYAIMLGPVSLVSAIGGVGPFFTFIYGLILSGWFPQIIQEDIRRSVVVKKIIAITLVFAGTLLINLNFSN